MSYMTPVKIVEILPLKVWIESDIMGSRHVVVHHQDYGKPFTYASFHYDYAYTCNAGTLRDANRLALELGATEPVEHKHRDIHLMADDQSPALLDVVANQAKEINRLVGELHQSECNRYRAPKQHDAPAWHDAPTCAGLWIASYSYKVRKLDEHDIAHLATLPFKQRWYGPIPADVKEQSA